MTETHEQRVERLARALYEASPFRDKEGPFEAQSETYQRLCKTYVCAIIASDREAGYVTVPREPTEAMVQAHIAECVGDADEADEARVRDCWAAMIEASLAAHEPK